MNVTFQYISENAKCAHGAFKRTDMVWEGTSHVPRDALSADAYLQPEPSSVPPRRAARPRIVPACAPHKHPPTKHEGPTS